MFAKVAAKNYALVKVSVIEAEEITRLSKSFSEGASVKQCGRYVNTSECLLAVIIQHFCFHSKLLSIKLL